MHLYHTRGLPSESPRLALLDFHHLAHERGCHATPLYQPPSRRQLPCHNSIPHLPHKPHKFSPATTSSHRAPVASQLLHQPGVHRHPGTSTPTRGRTHRPLPCVLTAPCRRLFVHLLRTATGTIAATTTTRANGRLIPIRKRPRLAARRVLPVRHIR